MKLSILTLTMPTRTSFLAKLKSNLAPQLTPEVEWLVRICDPKYSLGENRDMLRRCSRAEYISWIDDDDRVSDDYVSSILPLLDGVDQIGFEVELWADGVKDPKRDIHSLSMWGWFDTPTHYNRDISHLQPMRRELALSEPMEGGHGEDKRWADRMRGKVKTEHYIDKVLYYYLFRSGKDRASKCPRCQSVMTVHLATNDWCNQCGNEFSPHDTQKSCLWD